MPPYVRTYIRTYVHMYVAMYTLSVTFFQILMNAVVYISALRFVLIGLVHIYALAGMDIF